MYRRRRLQREQQKNKICSDTRERTKLPRVFFLFPDIFSCEKAFSICETRVIIRQNFCRIWNLSGTEDRDENEKNFKE